MTKSGKSVFYFGIYLLITGVLFCLIPTEFISILNLPIMPTAWARLMGIVVIILAGFYLIGGKNTLLPFIKGTIYMRLFFFSGVIALFLSGQMPKEILLLGIIDLLGAIWTMLSIKAEYKTS